MLVNIPYNLPAVEILKKENIAIDSPRKMRKIRIALLNLMPLKIATETDFIRLLSNNPVTISLDFIKLRTHKSKNTQEEHLSTFYKYFDEIRNKHYDGMIITGAPIELLEFEDVTYWKELQKIFNWAATNVTSTLYICWAAQAALYHLYGIKKYPLEKKMSGVFKHTVSKPQISLFRGFDDEFYIPHSRYTEIRKEDILRIPELELLSESVEAGVYIVMSRSGREFYMTGHSEYASDTLHNEYMRDIAKGLSVEMPANYYHNNDIKNGICARWHAHANLLFINWLNYYV
ncbi:MAG: homoserine O-succinyltransferase [Dysgonamonadaceae bacterium]|jgi:homoserine O-succinyltransferase|nr:homoserine O-succinyltransferase [Dysgonamonadaceae bacterium]